MNSQIRLDRAGELGEVLGSIVDRLGRVEAWLQRVQVGTAITGSRIAGDTLTAALFQKGVQPYNTNLSLTPVAYSAPNWRVTWGSATITFGDGTTQSIDAGQVDVTVAAPVKYLFWIAGNTTLQETEIYSDVLSDTKALVAVVSAPPAGDNETTQRAAVHVFTGLGEAIHSGVISANAIIASHLQADSVTSGKIIANAVTAAKIDTDAVTADKIQAGAVKTAKLDALAVTAAKINTDAITADKISASAVTSIKINAGAVTAGKISVTSLSAINADLGTITAGTITGGTVQTSAANPRVIMDSSGVRAYDGAGGIQVDIDAADGAFKAGWNGSTYDVVLDENGVTFIGATLRWKNGVTVQTLEADGATSLKLVGNLSWDWGGSLLKGASGIDFNNAVTRIIENSAAGGDIEIQDLQLATPKSAASGDLGSAALYFDEIWGRQLRFGATREIDPYADTATPVWFVTRKQDGTTGMDHKFLPKRPAASSLGWGYLGDSGDWWWNTYSQYVYSDHLLPRGGSDTGEIGTSVNYWNKGYFNILRYKSLASFEHHDDLAMIRGMEPDPETGMVHRDTIPSEILGEIDMEEIEEERQAIMRDAEARVGVLRSEAHDLIREKRLRGAARNSVEGKCDRRCAAVMATAEAKAEHLEEEADTGIDLGASLGLALGGVKKLTEVVEDMMGRLEAVEGAISGS